MAQRVDEELSSEKSKTYIRLYCILRLKCDMYDNRPIVCT